MHGDAMVICNVMLCDTVVECRGCTVEQWWTVQSTSCATCALSCIHSVHCVMHLNSLPQDSNTLLCALTSAMLESNCGLSLTLSVCQIFPNSGGATPIDQIIYVFW